MSAKTMTMLTTMAATIAAIAVINRVGGKEIIQGESKFLGIF